MTKIAIIPARGGSKRIPKKNIKLFLGKPIIAYAIETAINSNLFDEIIVSTDSSEIAEIAKNHGASVPFLRSKKNASDFATTFDVLEEVFRWWNEHRTSLATYACCIYPTAPFVSSDLLNAAFTKLVDNSFDSVFPVIKYGFPIQRSLKVVNEQGKMRLFQPEHLNSRSQDLENAYHDSGQFYFFNIESVLEQKKLWTNNTGVIEINELDAQDIDTETDWKLAEIKYKLKNE